MYKGIDVSSHNGKLDWSKLKAAGVQFAIIRIGWGKDLKKQDDTQALANMKACEQNGIPYGVYLYSYALTKTDIDSEIAHALRMVEGRKPTLGIWFDMEDADSYKANHSMTPYNHKELLTEFCKRFCDAIKKAGYKTGIYANLDYCKNVLLDISGYDLWLAQWDVKEPGKDCIMWQYSSKGKFDGAACNFDMNYFYGELEEKKTEPNTEVGKVTITLDVLKKGAKGEQVKTLQRLLISMGFTCGNTGVDGSFGPATETAVKRYQSKNKLSIDGSVGPATWNSLLK